jgi:hypothetical protein
MQKKTVAAIRNRLAIDRCSPLPQQIYVTWGSGQFGRALDARETLDHIAHGEIVGVYHLTSTRVMRVTRTLE